MARDRSKIYPVMGESDKTTKVFKGITIVLFSVILIGTLLYLVRDNAGVTGFAVLDFANSNYCSIKDNSVAPFVKPNIDCEYISHDDKSISLRFVNSNVEKGKRYMITSIMINDCQIKREVSLISTGDFEDLKLECDSLVGKNMVEVEYINVDTGLSFNLEGEVRLYS